MKISRANVNGLPFDGFKLKGSPTHTIIAGKIKMQDGKILGDPEGTPLQFS
tara:strand:+ start:620 stop:772 length:153 start_codon:yes stop_codon:yes gene_type:complete